MTKLRETKLRTVASKDLTKQVSAEITIEDPENAREIIELYSTDQQETIKKADV